MDLLLAIDLGGTKCAVGLYELQGDDFTPLSREVYPSGAYGNVDEIITLFLGKTDLQPEYACLGVAGVVGERNARMTNLSWTMDAVSLAEAFSLKGVKLINDLTALCAAVPKVDSEELFVLQEGVPEAKGAIAVLAPGTGLGEGYLLEDEALFFPQGSEGGHVNFSPVDDEQIALLQWLRKRHEVVSSEMVCSGPALSILYEFLKIRGVEEMESVKTELSQVADKTPVIVRSALSQSPCPLCVKTVELFLSLLGTEAGNLALKLYATKGLYLGGGILPRIVGKFPFTTFLDGFCRKGAMGKLVERIPVKVIMERDAVLHGAVRYGRKTFVN